MTFWLAIIVTVVVLYFVSSGISYVAMYRIGAKFPSRVAGTLFAPLEWLARRVVPFRSLYNGYLRGATNDSLLAATTTPERSLPSTCHERVATVT